MQLQIRFTSGPRPNIDQGTIEKILLSQLARFQHRVKQVQLYIEDVNGPRGGLDKHCRCVLHLRRMSPIIVRESDTSIVAMTYRVADRALHALRRKSDRKVTAHSNRRRTISESNANSL